MNLKIKIFIGVLLTVIILVGGWLTWGKREAPFEKCIKATSFTDYYRKAGIPFEEWVVPIEEWMKEWIKPASIPIRINFSGVEIYNIPVGGAGGDVFTKPIIKSGNLYCELTDRNSQKLFAPIQKEEAIKYLDFKLVTLGRNGYQVSRSTILDREDYEDVYRNLTCDKSISDSEKRITTLQETKDGFLINWVYYTMFGERAGYYQWKVKVGPDAKIQIIEETDKPFIDCGEGAIF